LDEQGKSIYRQKDFFKMSFLLINKPSQKTASSDFTCLGRQDFKAFGRSCACKNYFFYNCLASLLHLGNAMTMIYLFYTADSDGVTQKDVCYPLTMGYAGWVPADGNSTAVGDRQPSVDRPFIITQNTVDTQTLSLHWLIVGFHSLSFLFQFLPVIIDPDSPCYITLGCKYPYKKLVEDYGRNPLRFVEYAISAAIMLICIALLTGIRDGNLLLMIGILCAACQMMGLMAEYSDGFPRAVAHFTGWMSLMTAYGVIWAYYIIAAYQAGENKAPAFVHAIVISMFVLFNTFGIIQLTQFYCKNDRFLLWKGNFVTRRFYDIVGKEAELSYVAMSLIAKTVLGWVIYAQVLVMAGDC
jgi:hypothetical protein